jgi:hypothetical protein
MRQAQYLNATSNVCKHLITHEEYTNSLKVYLHFTIPFGFQHGGISHILRTLALAVFSKLLFVAQCK